MVPLVMTEMAHNVPSRLSSHVSHQRSSGQYPLGDLSIWAQYHSLCRAFGGISATLLQTGVQSDVVDAVFRADQRHRPHVSLMAARHLALVALRISAL